MTAKLSERLDRLERARASEGPDTPLPPELITVYLRAVAIVLGGYPRAPQAPSICRNSLGDGFARGLGYRDRDDMEARTLADPGDWHERTERAEAALCEHYGISALPDPVERAFQMMCGTLDEWAYAKAGGRLVPEVEDTAGLDRVMAFYGARPEPTEVHT